MITIRQWLRRVLPSRSVGARGERAAAHHLRRQGYRILARNLTTKQGEVDVLAEAPDRRTVVIVEVKSAEATGGGGNPPPEVHVDGRKQRQLAALAAHVARRYRLADRPMRFDVVGVELARGQKPRVRHHQAAFESHV